MNENQISKVVVDAAIEVHRELGGPGLLEDVYEEALAEELRLRGCSSSARFLCRSSTRSALYGSPFVLI
jgi:GxxExxY protein